MKSTRWKAALASVLGVLFLTLVIYIIVQVADPFEPRYQGRRVSESVLSVLNTNRLTTAEINANLKPMGARLAVPALARIAERDDAPLRRWYIRQYPRIPSFARKVLQPPQTARVTVRNAVFALRIFGPDAAPATTALVRVLERSEWSEISTALDTLRQIGPAAGEAIPSVLAVAVGTNSNHYRCLAIDTLAVLDPGGQKSGVALGALCADADSIIARSAIGAIGAMAQNFPPLATNL